MFLGAGRGGDGVCAGVSFRSPGSLIAEITGTVDDDPWAPDAMTWPLLEVIDCSLDQPWCRTLATHLGYFEKTDAEAELRRGRRYSVARRLAGLFASYARQRPQLLVDWLDGHASRPRRRPGLAAGTVAGAGRAHRCRPPHIRHQKTVARLREGPAELPARLSLFGHTRLARYRHRAARRAGYPPRLAPVAATPQRRALASVGQHERRGPPPRRHQPTRRPASAAGHPGPRPA